MDEPPGTLLLPVLEVLGVAVVPVEVPFVDPALEVVTAPVELVPVLLEWLVVAGMVGVTVVDQVV